MKILKNISFAFVAVVLASCGGVEDAKIDATTVQNNYTALEDFTPVTGGAEIKFNEKLFEFPEMEQGESVVHSFYFVNTGDKPLVLTDVHGSCGCTGVEFPEKPILPGEKGRIDAEVSTANKAAGRTFRVLVYVASNAITNEVQLELRGTPVESK